MFHRIPDKCNFLFRVTISQSTKLPASFGGQPSDPTDVIVSAVFIVIYAFFVYVHKTIHRRNKQVDHFFIFTILTFCFCMSRIGSFVMQICKKAHILRSVSHILILFLDVSMGEKSRICHHHNPCEYHHIVGCRIDIHHQHELRPTDRASVSPAFQQQQAIPVLLYCLLCFASPDRCDGYAGLNPSVLDANNDCLLTYVPTSIVIATTVQASSATDPSVLNTDLSTTQNNPRLGYRALTWDSYPKVCLCVVLNFCLCADPDSFGLKTHVHL